jgi:hypothetical protein
MVSGRVWQRPSQFDLLQRRQRTLRHRIVRSLEFLEAALVAFGGEHLIAANSILPVQVVAVAA